MKRILFFLCVSMLFVNCKDDVKLTATDELNKYVDDWVYQKMNNLYYWNTTLPSEKSTYDNPTDYFKTLKYKDDRFSAIFTSYQDILNELNGVSSAEIGFNFQLYLESSANDNVLGIVLYVKPGTPARNLDIKRGDIFRKINGQQLTKSNYSNLINTLYDSSASAKVTFSTYHNGAFHDEPTTTITKVANYNEDPVYLDTVYTVYEKKIGYLVYNFFTNDPGDKSMKYDLELNNAIGKFKRANISELIVDLRYNHGGMMTSAINLASMLVPNLSADQVFIYTEYNKNYTDYFNSEAYKSQNSENPFLNNFVTSIVATSSGSSITPVQNVGNNLQRIFFLTGSNTASASEMVINGLKPFLPCILIGDTTVGKNVGSTLVHDVTNTKNQWAFMPIILKYFNKNHQSDFTKGFVPDVKVSDDYSHSLGDTKETLLANAIGEMMSSGVNAAKIAPIKRIPLGSAIDLKRIRTGLIINNKATDSYLNRKEN